MYVGDYLARRCIYTPHKIAVIDVSAKPSARLSYREMNVRADTVASWLQQTGIGKGDRVGLLAHDGLHFYDLFFACCKLGAILAPYNWRLHAREIENQVRLTTPKIMFYSADKPIDAIVAHLRGCGEMPELLPLTHDEEINLAQIMAAHNSHPARCESLTERDTACLLFTGGTTGAPKAAQISHRQIVWNTFNALLGDVLGDDTFLNIFPMFHAGGLFAFSAPMLILGGTVIQTREFDPDQVLHLIEKERVTIFGGVPTIFQMLSTATSWDQADLSSLRYCLSGGAPMPLPLIRKYQTEKGVVFRQGFGMTEFGPDVFSLSEQDSERKAGSIGKPNYFIDARVVDPETNQPLAANQIGELVLRGPVATTGYFNDTTATQNAFDDDDYFHTGDLAYMDDEGYFFIVDRLKDMFISGGENVYPAEVEAILYKHPAVQMCAVIGIEDEQWGQIGCAFVVKQRGSKTSESELLHHVRAHLAKYKTPKSVIFLDELPLSGAGKVIKTKLYEMIPH